MFSDDDKPFEDPEDNEDMRVAYDNSMSIFWRMVIPNQRLIKIVELEPTLKKITVNMRNNSAGCWLVFTSRKVGKRISESFKSQGILNDFHSCDILGNEIINDAPVNSVIITKSRPWKLVDGETDHFVDLEVNEFFYCMIEENKLMIYFVPESYWNEHKNIFHGELGIEKVLNHFFKPVAEKSYVFEAYSDPLIVKTWLDNFGFRENLLFQNFIYESDL